MRKTLVLIITAAMMFSMVACATNEDVPIVTEPMVTEPLTTVTQPIEVTIPPETQPATPDEPTAPTIPPEPETFDVTISFTGDNMLASYKNQTTAGSFNEYAEQREPTYFLEKVRPIFEADDFTIVNLENVFTDRKLQAVSKNHDPAYWYCSKTSNVNILTSSSVEGVSIANNHTFDYGQQGYNDTVQTLNDANLPYGFNEHIMYFEKNGFTIAVICHGLWGEWQADDIIKYINKAEMESDYQIVFYHGGKEKVHEPDKWRVRASRKLVDAGADLVIGNHPHVLQPREFYNGAEILYSMGNFCYGGSRAPENRTIIYQMMLTVGENNQIVSAISSIIPCYVYTAERNNYQPAPIENQEEIDKVLAFMYGEAESPI